MRFSFELPVQEAHTAEEFQTAEAITEVTRAAVRAGFSAVYVTDHPAPDSRWVDAGGHFTLDPIATLAVAAAADPSVLVHTNVWIAGYRNPFMGAHLVHSLSLLARGRVILGVASGYLRPEHAALGAAFEGRGARLDDALEVLEEAFDGGDVVRSGDGYEARGVRLRPVAEAGRPPIWVGGNSRAAMRRAARFEGWSPFHTSGFAKASRTAPLESIEDLRAGVTEVRSLAFAESGERPFEICWSESMTADAGSSPAERVERLAALADAGVTWSTIVLRDTDRSALIERIEAFGRDVISEFAHR